MTTKRSSIKCFYSFRYEILSSSNIHRILHSNPLSLQQGLAQKYLSVCKRWRASWFEYNTQRYHEHIPNCSITLLQKEQPAAAVDSFENIARQMWLCCFFIRIWQSCYTILHFLPPRKREFRESFSWFSFVEHTK